MKTKRLLVALFLVTITTIIAGCGGSSSTPTPGALAMTTASLSNATIGTAYSQTLAANGGTAPYTWSISAGNLPAGLSLNASTGVISGTPTTAATTNFTVMVTDSATSAGTVTKTFSITVAAPAPLSITTTSPLAAGTVGTVYAPVTLSATGGTAPYTWSISAGTLPAGLSLNASTGVISGTPTTAATTNFTVMVTDSATSAGTATKAFSITVASTFDALAFYNTICLGCHGTLGPRTATQITNAIAQYSQMNQFLPTGSDPLTASQIAAIAAVSY